MKFEIYQSGGLWRWRLRAGNGEIIASGESYYNRSDCDHVVQLVKASAAAPVNYV